MSPDLYALLIGIDAYLPNVLPGGSAYMNLSGCVRDVQQVEAFLASRLGLTPERTLKLTASGPAMRPAEPEERWPTYANIVAAFQQITASAPAGSQVYIHYSGHGGRSRTIFPRLKGEEGLDEGLVPTDVREQGRYLRDVELAYLLQAMVDKGLVVTLVLDSCHSGGATRAIRSPQAARATPRGIGVVDTSSRPADSLVASRDQLEAAWLGVERGDRGRPASGWLLEPRGYTFLAACRANEFAYENAFDGHNTSGALTYWLLDTLRGLGAGATSKVVYDRLLPAIRSWMEAQTPKLQGEIDRAFFGADRVSPLWAIPVLGLDKTGQRVSLNAGEAHGLREGDLLAVYPLGSDTLTASERRQALIEVSELVDDADAWARIVETCGDRPVEQGSQAVWLGSSQMQLQRSVRLALEDEKLAAALTAAIAEHGAGFIRVAGPQERPDFQVGVEDGLFQLGDRNAALLPNLQPPIATQTADAPERVAKRLVHLVKYRNVQALDNPDPSMADKLLVELLVEENTLARGAASVVRSGDNITLRIRNRLPPNPNDINDARRILNIAVLDLSSDWAIAQVYPGAGAPELLQPGQSFDLTFEAMTNSGSDSGGDILKVFATQKTTDFRWLQLPALDEPPLAPPSNARGVALDPLDRLLAAVAGETAPTAEDVRTRKVQLVSAGHNRAWAVAQVEFRVQAGDH